MENVYKGALGGYKPADGSHAATHVILTESEYNDMVKESIQLRKSLDDERVKSANDIRAVEKNYAKENAEHIDTVINLKSKVKKLEGEVTSEKRKNANLIRICRERANSARGLKPKTEHSGFVVLSTSSYIERINKNDALLAFKTVIQTPYDMCMDLCVVNDMWWDELPWEVCDIGFLDANLGQNVSYRLKSYPKEENHIFKYALKLQRNRKFWEVEVYHSQPISGTCFSNQAF